MHSGGAQQFGQRSQPAQSVFVCVTGLVVRSPKHSFAAVGAARQGNSRGFQRSSLCLIVLTRALCASLVPRSAKSASALATFFANGCDAEASRSHVKTNAPRRRKFSRARRAPPARREGVGGHAPRLASASNARLAPVSGVDDERASEAQRLPNWRLTRADAGRPPIFDRPRQRGHAEEQADGADVP